MTLPTNKYSYTTVDEIIAKVYRDLNINEEVEDRWQDMVEWIAEALEHLHIYPTLHKKTETLDINNGIAKVPCDFYELIQLGNNTGLTPTSDTRQDLNNTNNPLLNNSYYFEYPYIKTSQQKGTIQISYLAAPVDPCTGFPMVPDNISVREALFWFILMKMILGGYKHPEPLFSYMFCERQWKWKLKQAKANYHLPNLNEMERLSRAWNRLIPDQYGHIEFFQNNNRNYREKGLTKNNF
jgi:hypothetical protein